MTKKILIFILLSALLACSLSSCAAKYDTGEDVSIIVATDLHYISPSLTENEELFRVAVDNADGKVSHYSEEVTDAFIDKVISEKPEAVILSGDLTFNGAKASHEDLVKKLKRITDAGIAVLAQPGNHDVNSTQAYTFSGEKIAYTEALSAADFRETYSEFGLDGALSVDESSFSYSYQTGGNLRIIMIDSNSNGKGFVADSTLEWLEGELKQAKQDRVDVLTVTHQNLYAHSSLLSFGYQLYNATTLEELLIKYGVKCHLSGHIHVQSVATGDVTEIVTSSLPLANVQYGALTYSDGSIDYAVEGVGVAEWARANGISDAELLGFEEYAIKYFKDNCYRQVRSAFAESELSNEEIELLAKTFAEINIAYFMGETIDPTVHAAGVSLWHEKGADFFAGYIDSMLDVNSLERRKVTVKLD